MNIDPRASTHGLPSCLISPVAARTISGIQEYVGKIESHKEYPDFAFTVELYSVEEKNDFDIWNHPRSMYINNKKQLWVDVDFKYYKKAYELAFPEHQITEGIYIDHIMNRKLARLHGYKYVRVIHVNHSTNTSSGRGPETMSIKKNPRIEECIDKQKDVTVQYADPFDILKILDIPTGGKPYLNVGDVLEVLYDGGLLENFFRDRIIGILKNLNGINCRKNPTFTRKISLDHLIKTKNLVNSIEEEIYSIRRIKRLKNKSMQSKTNK